MARPAPASALSAQPSLPAFQSVSVAPGKLASFLGSSRNRKGWTLGEGRQLAGSPCGLLALEVLSHSLSTSSVPGSEMGGGHAQGKEGGCMLRGLMVSWLGHASDVLM